MDACEGGVAVAGVEGSPRPVIGGVGGIEFGFYWGDVLIAVLMVVVFEYHVMFVGGDDEGVLAGACRPT